MLPEQIRISVKLENCQDPELFLRLLEEELGRPVKPVQRLLGGRILSLRGTKGELERIRQIPGVQSAGPEGRCELPPAPRTRKRA